MRRAMLVSADVMQTLEATTNDALTDERLGRLRADLEVFVSEPVIYPKYMFWLTPKRDFVWEVRSVEDEPSIRVLGRFIGHDAFVALTVETRDELKGWNSPSWKRAIRTCVQRWNTIFNPYPCHTGSKPDDFFTGSVPVQYFKK